MSVTGHTNEWCWRSRKSEPPEDDAALRALWTSVLSRLLNDWIGNAAECPPLDREKLKTNARAYFKAENLDFRIVCLLAGLEEPDRVLAFAQKAMSDSDAAIARGERYTLPESLFEPPLDEEGDGEDEFLRDQIASFKP